MKVDSVRRELNLPRLGEAEITSRLKHLGYLVSVHEGGKEFTVTVPSWRLWSVSTEASVIEDIARVHGLNRVKLSLPPLDYEEPEHNPNDMLLEKMERSLVGSGFLEVVTKSYYSGDDVRMLEGLSPGVSEKHVALKNAVDSGYSHLKITNFLHLARVVERNLRQGVLSCKIYEFGRLFSREKFKRSPYDHERDVLSLMVGGRWNCHEWRKEEAIEELLGRTNGIIEMIVHSIGASVEVGESNHPYLHPGRQGSLRIGKTECGFFGALHPSLSGSLELSGDAVYGELWVPELLTVGGKPQFSPPIDFPSIRRDVTVKVPTRTLALSVAKKINELSPTNLQEIGIVDEFRKGDEPFRRITYRLTFQDAHRTLEHSEVDSAMELVLKSLRDRHGFEIA